MKLDGEGDGEPLGRVGGGEKNIIEIYVVLKFLMKKIKLKPRRHFCATTSMWAAATLLNCLMALVGPTPKVSMYPVLDS